MLGIRAGARDFMQRAQEKAAGGEAIVEGLDAERDDPRDGPRVPIPMGDPRDLVAELGEGLGSGGR